MFRPKELAVLLLKLMGIRPGLKPIILGTFSLVPCHETVSEGQASVRGDEKASKVLLGAACDCNDDRQDVLFDSKTFRMFDAAPTPFPAASVTPSKYGVFEGRSKLRSEDPETVVAFQLLMG